MFVSLTARGNGKISITAILRARPEVSPGSPQRHGGRCSVCRTRGANPTVASAGRVSPPRVHKTDLIPTSIFTAHSFFLNSPTNPKAHMRAHHRFPLTKPAAHHVVFITASTYSRKQGSHGLPWRRRSS